METAKRKFTYTLRHAYMDLVRTHGNTAFHIQTQIISFHSIYASKEILLHIQSYPINW